MKKTIFISIVLFILLFPKYVYATTIEDNIDSAIQKLENLEKSSFLNSHSVGGIYITTASDENTAAKMKSKYGGTWAAYGTDKFLIGTTGTSEITGGSTTKTLSVSNLPSHTHSYWKSATTTDSTSLTIEQFPNFLIKAVLISGSAWSVGSGWGGWGTGYCATMVNQPGYGNYGQGHTHSLTLSFTSTGVTGSGKSFNIQNPYITVYMWKRTA